MINCKCGNEIGEDDVMDMCGVCLNKFVSRIDAEDDNNKNKYVDGFGIIDDEEEKLIDEIFVL